MSSIRNRGQSNDEPEAEVWHESGARAVGVDAAPRRPGALLMVPEVVDDREPRSERLERIGDVIADKYRLESEIGSGGMGVVYKAYRGDLDSYVALKLLRPAFGFDPQTVARFLQEARTAAALKSPHVARVLDFGTLPLGGGGARPYIVMEYLHGQDLGQVLNAGPLGVAEAIDYVIQASHAIAEAHAQGVVHRDLKPANLFRNDEGEIKVLDFGIAKPRYAPPSRLTRAGLSLGSPHYMSPEQVDDPKFVDSRADVYSFGICLYELLTGAVPFDGETFGELVTRIVHGSATPLGELRRDLPIGLAEVVHRAFARDPQARYQRVADFVGALAPYAPPRSRRLIELLAPLQAATPTDFVRAASTVPFVSVALARRTPSSGLAVHQQERESMASSLRSRRSLAIYLALALIVLLFAGKFWGNAFFASSPQSAALAADARAPINAVGVLQANVPAPEPISAKAPSLGVAPAEPPPSPSPSPSPPPSPSATPAIAPVIAPAAAHSAPVARAVNNKRPAPPKTRPPELAKATLNLDNRAPQ